MATGRSTQLTKQAGEYLVAAELCRRGLIATTFTGNVPHYDLIASDATGHHLPIQVKAIRGTSWQFNAATFVDISLDGKRQILGKPKRPPYPDLICVFVKLVAYGTDRFFIFEWKDLQRIVIGAHREFLDKHSGVRPRKPASFHTAVRPDALSAYEGNWELIEKRLKSPA